MKKVLAIILSVLLLCTSLTCLSACNNEGDENTFTWLIENPEDTTFYSDYNQNPTAIFLQKNQQYAGVDITIDYKQLVNGSQKDQYTTMISTGEYYDVMGTSYSPYSPLALYDMGIAMDITEYVEKYMPNYMKLIEENESLGQVAYNTTSDGKKVILQIWMVTDVPQYGFQGFCYRRDWIVKYGVNPSTGEAFEGHMNEDRTYTDNVKFPSWYSDNAYVTEYKANHPDWDGSEPIFISDWEWMFEIFDKARADLGVTDKGYDISIYYTGYLQTGDLFSAFGGGAPMWSYNYKTGQVEFNATSDSMKAYLECMSTWYEKGWLDKEFAERSSDMFYKIDISAVYSGYVGMWQGHRSTLADQLEQAEDYPATKGIYVSGARQPINDIYGDESCKGNEPYAMYQMECTAAGIIITDQAKDKNLEALFTYLDTLYEAGSTNYVAKNYGLTKEQYDFIKPYQETVNGQTFQERFDIDEDAYSVSEKNGAPYYTYSDKLMADSNLRNAAIANRLPCLSIQGETSNISKFEIDGVVNKWGAYINKGYIQSTFEKLLTTEQNEALTKTKNKINDKMSVEIPKFINGTYDINSADWDTYCKTIDKMGYQKITGYLQGVYDSLK